MGTPKSFKNRNWDLVGTPKAGYGNTVPVTDTNGMWGVWNKELEKFVNDQRFNDADRAIEAYDDLVMAERKATLPIANTMNHTLTIDLSKMKTTKTTKVKVVKIYRERGGDKATWAAEINAKHPTMGLQDVSHLANREHPDVSPANFRYLINKIRTKAATAA